MKTPLEAILTVFPVPRTYARHGGDDDYPCDTRRYWCVYDERAQIFDEHPELYDEVPYTRSKVRKNLPVKREPYLNEAGETVIPGRPQERGMNPPLEFATEQKLLLQPFSFMTRCFTLPDLFAGKMHALVFRSW